MAAMACADRLDRPDPLPGWMLTADSMGVRASDTATTGHLKRADLVEASGAALSMTQPGVLFTINDSGHDPLLYATDLTGSDRGAWRVTGARNDDWEAIAIGPCAGVDSSSSADQTVPQCVYIGDTGDNAARKSTRTIYRVPEPTAQAAGFTGTTPLADRLTYKYSNGPEDVEALFVGPNSDVFLISRQPKQDAAGRLRSARLYHLPAAAWSGHALATAHLVDSLPIVPGSAPWRAITDAALAPDHRHVAVRTYTQIFVFVADRATGRIVSATPPAVCNVAPLRVIGEGVAWADASGTLVLTSEGRGAPINRVRCPLPLTARDSR